MQSLVSKQDITPRVSGKKAFAGNFLWAVVILLVLGLLAGGIFYLKSPQNPLNTEPHSTEPPVTQTNGQPSSAPEPSHSAPTAESTQSSSSAPTVPGVPVAPTVQQPVCTHSYAAASCIAPATCKSCGDTVGNADPAAHSWTPEYAPVRHDQVGHYETREVQYQKNVYLCFFCGYNQDGYNSLEDLRAHIAVHANAPDYAYVTSRPDMLADTRQVWASKYEQVWVVDKEAYDEMRLVGYTCTLCGSTKAAE